MKQKLLLSALVLLFAASGKIMSKDPAGRPAGTAGEIIEMIIRQTASPVLPNTVDVIKEGDPSTPVKGIVTTMFASMDVLRKAVALGCNLIIAHEPLYYNHTDATAQFAGDPVFLEKQKYIRDNKLVIWRFHDYIHRMQPDGIQAGMASKLGWEKYLAKGSTSSFLIPETNLGSVLAHLKTVFPGSVFNVIGNKDMKVQNVKIAVGAPGSQSHFRLLREEDTELLLAGEVPQWETYEYVRDAVAQGRNKAVVFLGHVQSEEAGMDYCATWLKGFIKDIPVYFVATGASYWSY